MLKFLVKSIKARILYIVCVNKSVNVLLKIGILVVLGYGYVLDLDML